MDVVIEVMLGPNCLPPHRRTISDCIALAAAHEMETVEAAVLDPDFEADVDKIVRNRKPRKLPSGIDS
jgi:hypothetical protein